MSDENEKTAQKAEEPKPTIPPSEPSASNGAKPKKRSAGKIIAIIVGVFVLGIVVFAAIIFFLTRGAAEAAEEIVANIQSGNCTIVYNDQAAAAFQAQGSLELWVAECERVGGILTGEPSQTGVSVEGSAGEASTSLVLYAIQGNDGVTYDVSISMVKVDGDWKMSAFNSVAQTN